MSEHHDRVRLFIQAHYEAGDRHLAADRFEDALRCYEEALALVPTAFEEWEGVHVLFTAIGEARFFKQDYAGALAAFEEAVKYTSLDESPLLHLRLGQAHYELGDRARAAEALARALQAAGEAIFAGEDPKYLAAARGATS